MKKSNLFPGISELIRTLRNEGHRIGVVSSSERTIVLALLKKFDITTDFMYHSSLFGKAAVLKKALTEQSLTRSETIYVGDEVRDVEACQKAGLDVIAVTWGLNSKEALQASGAETIDSREALLERLRQ